MQARNYHGVHLELGKFNYWYGNILGFAITFIPVFRGFKKDPMWRSEKTFDFTPLAAGKTLRDCVAATQQLLSKPVKETA
jgi:hypothetical protein